MEEVKSESTVQNCVAASAGQERAKKRVAQQITKFENEDVVMSVQIPLSTQAR